MNILVYNRHFYPSIGGTENSGQIMARELAALDHTVTVVTATGLPDGTAELDEGYVIVRDERLKTLRRLAQAHDVLFSRGGVSLRAVSTAIRAHKPLVIFHEADAAAGRTGLSFKRRVGDAFKLLARRRARLHVTVSDALVEIIGLPARARWFRLYNPVPDALWTNDPPGFAARDLDLLYVGRLAPIKGLAVFRDALATLPGPARLQVAVVGAGDAAADWQVQFRETGMDVAFLGPVGGDALRALYARARIAVIPSLVREGMGMVAAEALANGTPVCASDQPALREVVGSAGLFHQMGNASGLASDIGRLLDDPILWHRLWASTSLERARFKMTTYRRDLAELVDQVPCAISETSYQKSSSFSRSGGR